MNRDGILNGDAYLSYSANPMKRDIAFIDIISAILCSCSVFGLGLVLAQVRTGNGQSMGMSEDARQR